MRKSRERELARAPKFLKEVDNAQSISYHGILGLEDLMPELFIAAHPGLGDHVLCNGLYRELATQYNTVLVAASSQNNKVVEEMLSDLNTVQIISFGPLDLYWIAVRLYLEKIRKKSSMQIVGLGHFGDSFMQGCRFDESFYNQARIPFVRRWDNFAFPRNIQKQEEVFNSLVGSGAGDYLFVHDDEKRNMKIELDDVNKQKIVKPKLDHKRYSIFDYELVIRRSSQIHCIESSFAALIEGFNIDIPKFAHRYARPEAKNDWKSEFTYKSNWTVIL